MGLLSLPTWGERTNPFSSVSAISHDGWPCKGQRETTTTTTAQGSRSPGTPTYLPKSAEVRIQNDHLIPSWRRRFRKEAGGQGRAGPCPQGWLQDPLTRCRGTSLGRHGQQGWTRQEAAEGRRSNLGIHHPPEGYPEAAHAIGEERGGHSGNYHCVTPRKCELIKIWLN